MKVVSKSVGTPFGHVPGHHFHDVDVRVSRHGARWRIEAEERWGSAQGRDEIHGSRKIAVRADTLFAASHAAKVKMETAGMDMAKGIQALSQAVDEAEDVLTMDEQPTA